MKGNVFEPVYGLQPGSQMGQEQAVDASGFQQLAPEILGGESGQRGLKVVHVGLHSRKVDDQRGSDGFAVRLASFEVPDERDEVLEVPDDSAHVSYLGEEWLQTGVSPQLFKRGCRF
ncbi:Zn-dependent hydrolase [Babesia caballi]|uniref:Zn-dependent hydrolase n=1 Tax=Babesia caballi TaxID=5871 RepID=A0AAV4LY91_BABCB|nr:Zn-dependent hydrolase [Babesia caballi]